MDVLGTYSLTAALLSAAVGLLASVAGGRFDSKEFLRVARGAILCTAALFTLGGALLLMSILSNDFRLLYVAKYSERAMGEGYKIAALWAGQEGSLLLWAWMLAIMASIAAFTIRKDSAGSQWPPLAILAGVLAFFAVLMLFSANDSANPFKVSAMVPPDGHGMNPMLQNPGMIWHPPMLFLGYAGFTIPFAFAMGALIAGRTDNLWVATIRRWATAAWLFLSIGIVLGMQWAYVELGWGGYWAWDPVENASLLPWFTGTAMLHTMISHQRRGMLKLWNVAMIAVTFLLCIFGTYLTRSGVIASVHAYAKSPVGMFFLVFLGLLAALSLAVILWRRDLLKPDRSLAEWVSREGAFAAASVLLVIMMATTLVGTVFPLLTSSSLFFKAPMTLDAPFYNKVIVPLAMVTTALMGAGPFLGAGGREGLRRRLMLPAIGAVMTAAVTGLVVGVGPGIAWALCTAALAGFVVTGLAADFASTLRKRLTTGQENPLLEAARMFRANARRYGGQLVHLSIVLMMIGMAGSSLYPQKQDLQIPVGKTAQLGGHALRVNSVKEIDRIVRAGEVASEDAALKCDRCGAPTRVAAGQKVPPCVRCGGDLYVKGNYGALVAEVAVIKAGSQECILRPELRLYDNWPKDRFKEVAVHSTLAEDVYLILHGRKPGEGAATFTAMINPLLTWIWIGGVLLTVGSLICLIPRTKMQPPDAEG